MSKVKTYKYEDLHPKHELFTQERVLYWGKPNEEVYEHTDPYDAVEMALDSQHPTAIADLEEVLTIVAVTPDHTRVHIDSDDILELVLEGLDENCASLDGDPTEPTEKMKAAARFFARTIEREYVPWICKEVARAEVDVALWVKENRPDWLGDES